MHRQLVSHAITVPRPLDWATVCAIVPEVHKVAKQFKLSEPRFSRLMPKNDHVTAQHSTRDRWEWDWKAPGIAVLVEGWVEKE